MSDNRENSVPWRPVSRRRTISQSHRRKYWASFRQAKFEVNNYFAYYRRGLRSEKGEPWLLETAEQNPDSILYRQYDTFRRIRGPWENIYKATMATRRGGRLRFQDGLFAGPNRGPVAFQVARSLKISLDRNRVPIKILKLLGNGSNGVALLCDTRNAAPGDGSSRRFVLKADINGRQTMSEEKQHMMALKRAPHIAQMLRFKEIVPTASDEVAELLDQDDAVQLLEFCKHGDLLSLLEKASKQPLEGKHVLKIFACLIRACISMHYPPRRAVARDGSKVDDAEAGESIPETIPPSDLQDDCAYNLVHFDLDPQNILLGDVDGGEHQFMPICCRFIVMADDLGITPNSGLAKRTTSSLFTDPIDVMYLRRTGKPDHPLPEQLHKEWEFVDILPQNQMPQPKVAGQYGPASNVFAIGLCMHSVVTGASPPDPLEAFGPLNDPVINDYIPAEYHTIHDLWNEEVEIFYTYGGLLTQENYGISPTVIILILRCMADQPAHRPSLEELKGWVDSFEAIEGSNDADHFYESIFGRPSDARTEILTEFPDAQPPVLARSRSHHGRPNSEPLLSAAARSRSTVWMGPPRATSASAVEDLGPLPGLDRGGVYGGSSNGGGSGGENEDDNGDGSSEAISDGLDARTNDDNNAGGSGSTSNLKDSSQKNDNAGSAKASPSSSTSSSSSSSSRQNACNDNNNTGTGGLSSDRPTVSSKAAEQKGSVRTGSGQGHSQGDQETMEPETTVGRECEQGIMFPSYSGLIDSETAFSDRADSAALSSRADMDRITVSPNGVSMFSDDDDDDHDNVNQDRTVVPTSSVTRNGRQASSASAAALAFRAARQSGPGPSRLARLLARLRIRPLASPAPARKPRPDDGAPRDARSRRLGFLWQARQTAVSDPAATPGPGAPTLVPTATGNQRKRSRPAPAPERRTTPRLGSQQGIPYPNASGSASQPQGIPVIPAGDNATLYPPYVHVEGIPDLLIRPEARIVQGPMQHRHIPPPGDPRLLGWAFAGEAAINMPLRGGADTIWHAPSLDMEPIPGYFRTHLSVLLGVQRYIYFYQVGSDGANAVLGARLQNAGQSSEETRPW